MRTIERAIGITIGTVFLAAGPALAAAAAHPGVVGWATADAVARQRVAGDIVATRLASDGGRGVYNVDVRTTDNRIEDVEVDAHNAHVVGVHEVTEPGVVGEVEAP
jgi:hypothetical protein